MKIAVVDDYAPDLKAVEEALDRYQKEKGVRFEVHYFADGEYLRHELEDGARYDVYFLDVEMPRMSGIETAASIRARDKNAHLIFITSHLGYAPNASEYLIFRYIDKVSLEEKLAQTLDSVIEDREWRNARKEYYYIVSQQRQERIHYMEILYLYKSGKNTIFVKRDGESRVRKSLEQTLQELDPEVFVMTDRSYIVNIHHVMKVEGGEVYLRGGKKVPIGKAREQEVRALLLKSWGVSE